MLTGCISAGTLGGFDLRIFPTSKRDLVKAIDTLYSRHPEYKIPDKWKTFDDWHERGYSFLDGRIFYFNASPEEIYYAPFYGDANDSIQSDTTKTALSIRAYRNNKFGWTKEDDCSSKEKKRVQQRFDQEIISKLEEYTNTKSTKEKE
jgi:hypothetical protein